VWSRTVDIDCKGFPAGTLFADLAKSLFDYFVDNHPEFKVVSIQQCPARVARVSFSTDSGAAKITLEELGAVTVRGVQCPVIRPAPPPPRVVNVIVYNYPFEFCDAPITTTMGNYGSVKHVGFQRWTNIPNCSTGTRLVRMTVLKVIPRFLFINGFRCKVWYREQPLTCDVCSKNGHKASDCPDKGKCLRCHQSGHMARDCPNPWGVAQAAPPVLLDAALLPPPGDLSQGLQHAEDLDTGFGGADPEDTQDGALASQDDSVLADAASVAEAVVGAFSQSEGAADPGVEPDVIILDEGDVAPSGSSCVGLSERFNQLDELDSQLSQSILPNCGSGGAPPGGELSSVSQISNSCLSNSNENVSNLSKEINSNESDSINLSMSTVENVNSNNEENVNYYGSVTAVDGASSGTSLSVDAEMTQASDPKKRPISEDSSDREDSSEASGSVSIPNSKGLSRRSRSRVAALGRSPSGVGSFAVPKPKVPPKKSKTCSASPGRLPGSVSHAARMASPQGSVRSKK